MNIAQTRPRHHKLQILDDGLTQSEKETFKNISHTIINNIEECSVRHRKTWFHLVLNKNGGVERLKSYDDLFYQRLISYPWVKDYVEFFRSLYVDKVLKTRELSSNWNQNIRVIHSSSKIHEKTLIFNKMLNKNPNAFMMKVWKSSRIQKSKINTHTLEKLFQKEYDLFGRLNVLILLDYDNKSNGTFQILIPKILKKEDEILREDVMICPALTDLLFDMSGYLLSKLPRHIEMYYPDVFEIFKVKQQQKMLKDAAATKKRKREGGNIERINDDDIDDDDDDELEVDYDNSEEEEYEDSHDFVDIENDDVDEDD